MPPIGGAPSFRGTRSIIRSLVSPVVTRVNGFIGSSGFNRDSLISHLREQNLTLKQQAQVIRVLESESVIKARFQGEANDFSELGQFMVASSLTADCAKKALQEVKNLVSGVEISDVSGQTRKVTGQLGDLFFGAKHSLAHRKYSPIRTQELAANLHFAINRIIGDKAESQIIQDAQARFLYGQGSTAIIDRLKRIGIPQHRRISRSEQDIIDSINKLSSSPSLQEAQKIAKALLKHTQKTSRDIPLRRFIKSTICVLDALIASPNDTGKIEDAVHGNLMNLNKLMNRKDPQQWGLIAFCSLTIIFSTLYMFVRFNQTVEPGYNYLSYLSSAFLLSAELFCFYLGFHSNAGAVYALLKTDGAHGQSWLGKVRTIKQEEVRAKRAPVVLFLSAFNEPVGVALRSFGYAMQAAWEHGNACVQLLDDTYRGYHLNGLKGAVRTARYMSARVEIIRQMGDNYEAACDLAALRTELGDRELDRFAILRAVEDIGIGHNILQRKAKILSRRVWHKFKDLDTDKKEVSASFVRKEALSLGIRLTQAEEIGRQVEAEIQSLVRKERIAALAGSILEGRGISLLEQIELAELLLAEHPGIGNARALVASLVRNYANINQMAAAAVGEMDFYSNQTGREHYYAVHLEMEKTMQRDEKEENIEVDMQVKFRRIVEWELFNNPQRISLASRFGRKIGNSHHSYYLSDQIGREIAIAVNNMLKLYAVLELELSKLPAVTRQVFLEKEAEVWEQRKAEIRKKIKIIMTGHSLTNPTDIRNVQAGITDNLEENRNERRAAAMELMQSRYAGHPLKKPQITGVTDYSRVQNFAKNSAVHVLRERGDKVAVETPFGPFREKSGKASEIDMAIHGFTKDLQLGSMLRQILLKKQLEQKGEPHIPEDVLSYIDPKFVNQIPDTFKSEYTWPEYIIGYIAFELNRESRPEKIVEQLIKELRIPWRRGRNKQILNRVTQEILARIALHKGIQHMGDNRLAVSTSLPAGLGTLNAARVQQLLRRVTKEIKEGKMVLERSQTGKPWVLRLSKELRLEEFRVSKGYRVGDTHHLETPIGLYTFIHESMIVPEGRSPAQIAEWMIAARRLPERTSNAGNFGSGDFATALRRSAEMLEKI